MHQPVLLNEVIELIQVKPEGVYIDGTVGGGGHAAAILERLGEHGRLLGIDRDPEALERLTGRFAGWGPRCSLEHGSYADMIAIAQSRGITGADGILLDLGVSSDQLDTPARGFSFMRDGPLDMRLDPTAGRPAADWVNRAAEEDLARIFHDYGEEPRARRIARAIIADRARAPFETTARLAALVARAAGGRRGSAHPATRVFQALRIAVNDELGALARGLAAALALLKAGGRLLVISFHSLEDRLVKECFARHAGRWVSLQAGGRRWEGAQPAVRRLTRKPVTPGAEELECNPRARSARLRAVERLDGLES